MLPHTARLPKYLFSILLKEGIKRRFSHIFVVYRATDNCVSRFGIMVPMRIFKQATIRNRMKRVLREAIRLSVDMYPQHIDAVFVVQRKPEHITFEWASQQIDHIWHTLKKKE